MREYPIKKKHEISDELLKNLMLKIFGNVKKEGEFYISSYGSLELIKVKLENKKLYAETKSNNKKELYDDTISKYNDFIEKATGYTAAERKKLLTKI
ncbi:MAG: DUF5611 family protein [Thermoplasmata archaeon]|nr:DUF5611 family protein [Thermoplasmata archaeon]